MKKTAILVILALIIFPCFSTVLASESVYDPGTEWIKTNETAKSLQWHYAPEFTCINSDGKLETWIKARYAGENTQYSKSGEYSIYHIFITLDLDKFKNTEWSDFNPDETLVQTVTIQNAKWKAIPSGTSFEQCLRMTLAYAINK